MALIPSTIADSLVEKDSALGQIFTNVSSVVESVSSIYDQIRGEADGIPAVASTPAPAPKPAPAPVKVGMSNATIIFIGLAVVMAIGMFWSRR